MNDTHGEFDAPYRSPPVVPRDATDALHALNRRISRWRSWSVSLVMLAALSLGLYGYVFVREVFFAVGAVHWPAMTTLLSMGPAFMVALAASKWISRAVGRWRGEAWCEQLAARHGVAIEELRASLELWR